MKNLLKNKGLSETPFRNEVLAVFEKFSNAIPLSVIEDNLNNYNRITLYRTIKIFLKKGIIHEITISGEVSNFAICSSDCGLEEHIHQHIHFKCNTCQVISCVELDKFPDILLPNYTIDQLEIQISGICENCNK